MQGKCEMLQSQEIVNRPENLHAYLLMRIQILQRTCAFFVCHMLLPETQLLCAACEHIYSQSLPLSSSVLCNAAFPKDALTFISDSSQWRRLVSMG